MKKIFIVVIFLASCKSQKQQDIDDLLKQMTSIKEEIKLNKEIDSLTKGSPTYYSREKTNDILYRQHDSLFNLYYKMQSEEK